MSEVPMYTRNPKPDILLGLTRNTAPQTPHPVSHLVETLDPKPYLLPGPNPLPHTPNHKPQTSNLKPLKPPKKKKNN